MRTALAAFALARPARRSGRMRRRSPASRSPSWCRPRPAASATSWRRLLAQRLQERWGQQVIVENRGGANHAIGAAMVARAAPDGHALMVAAETVFVINPALHGNSLPYDVKDFAPVSGLVRINQGLLAHPSLPAGNIARADRTGEAAAGRDHLRLVRFRRGRPRQRGAAGKHGRHQARAGALPRRDAGAQRRARRPYHAHLGQPQRVGAALSRRQGQNARRSAVTQRRPEIPEVPTIAETVPGYEAMTWFGLFTTGRHAARRDRQAQRRGAGAVRRRAVRERVIVPNMFETDGELARAVRGIHPRGDREMVGGPAAG